MEQDVRYDVAVVGAGIVGVCCAAWLQKSGKSVVLIDRDAPGSGASAGNAGTIAAHACVPVNSPSLPFQLPSLMFGSDQPLAIDAGYVLAHMPWMLRFLANCTPGRVTRIVASLAAILRQSEAGLLPLIDDAGLRGLMRDNGCLHLFRDPEAWQDAQASIETKRAAGARVEAVTPDTIAELEPALGAGWSHGAVYEGYYWTTDPRALTQGIADQFARGGGTILRAAVGAFERDPQGGLVIRTDAGLVRAGQVVLAAGAWSTRIGGGLVEPLPLETERGYHVMFPGAGNLLSRPVSWPAAAFYLTPMADGLRAAGTVEIAGLDAAPNRRRLAYIERKTREMLPGLGAASETWLGFRPTMPDALPVIGRSARTPEIILAFGHQHLGLTLAGITGKMVVAIAAGATPTVDIAPYSPQRFG